MKKISLLVAVLVVFGFATPSNADTIYLTTPGIVGLTDMNGFTASADDATRLAYAQQILNLPANFKTDVDAVTPGVQYPVNGSQVVGYQTGPVEYSAILTLGYTKTFDDFGNVADSGWDYVLGKYDGPNAGYVLFHIPTYGTTTLPETAGFPDWNGAYGLSGWTVFNRTQVPDGGSMVMLLGLALMGLAGVRRMVK